MNTWKEKNPEWDYILWDNKLFEETNWINKKHIEYFYNRKEWHGVADICRYEILHTYGGFTIDADSECLNPIDELFIRGRHDAFAVYEQERIRPGLMSPLLASTRGNIFTKALISGLLDKKEIKSKPWRETGNFYMKVIYNKTRYQRLKIFPSYFFNSPHYSGAEYKGTGKMYARQFWGTTKDLYND